MKATKSYSENPFHHHHIVVPHRVKKRIFRDHGVSGNNGLVEKSRVECHLREMSCSSHGVLSLFKAPNVSDQKELAQPRVLGGGRGKLMKRDSNGKQCDHPKGNFCKPAARRGSGLVGSRPQGAMLESRPSGGKMAPLLGGGWWTLDAGNLAVLGPPSRQSASKAL